MATSTRDAILEALRRREEAIRWCDEYRAQIGTGLWSADVNLRHETRTARARLEDAAEFVQEVARTTGDVHLAGIAAMAVMDVEAADEREALEQADQSDARKAELAFHKDISQCVDEFLVGFDVDMSRLHALVDEKTPSQVDRALVEPLHKYIDHGGRSRSLRDAMVGNLYMKLKAAATLPTADDLKTAAVDAMPNLHRSMQSYIVKKLTTIIAADLGIE